jgi:P pilus assembly chaperone PapD
VREEEGKVRVTAMNTGNAHVQLGKLDLLADGNVVGTRSIAEYVLPGNARYWMLETHGKLATGAKVRISTTSDAGPLQADVPLEIDTASNESAAKPALASR